MKKILLSFLLIALGVNFSVAQSWLWGREGFGDIKSSNAGSSVATDKLGNAYLVGTFDSYLIFNPDTVKGGAGAMYLAKFDASGKTLWVTSATNVGIYASFGNGVATDDSNNVYVAGGFNCDTVYLDTIMLINKVGNGLLVKYNSAGNALWAINLPIPGNCVMVDKNGDIYVCSSNLYKYTSSGKLLWSQSVYGTAATIDNTNNIYVAGSFTVSEIIGKDTLQEQGAPTSFVAKYNSAGNPLWARQSKGPKLSGVNKESSALGIGCDMKCAPYVTGYYNDTLIFNSDTLFSPGRIAMYLIKYDSSGNVRWVNTSHNHPWEGSSVATDVFNNVYIGGLGNGDSLEIGNIKLGVTKSTSSSGESFIVEIDTAGNMKCGSMLNNGANSAMPESYYTSIASDYTGKYIYLAGVFRNGDVVCGPDTLIPNGGYTPYLGRWKGCEGGTQGIDGLTNGNDGVMVYPNPSDGMVSFVPRHYKERSRLEIYNMMGERIYAEIAGSISKINISSWPQGIYLYRLVTDNGEMIGAGKLIKE